MDQKMIGQFIKELRKEKNITQEELAQKLNVSNRTISRWETGNNMPDISILVELSEIFDVSIPEIINAERKSENMNEESKELVQSMSEYATSEKEILVKEIRRFSIIGTICIFIFILFDTTQLWMGNEIVREIVRYCQLLPYVLMIITACYTTGLINKFNKNKGTPESRKIRAYIGLSIYMILMVILIKFIF